MASLKLHICGVLDYTLICKANFLHLFNVPRNYFFLSTEAGRVQS